MTERSSYWISVLAALVGLGAAGAGQAHAQAELGDVCAAATAPSECNLAVATVQVVQPRIGTALWGGNPVSGTAGTLGFRIGATPRLSVSARALVVPATVPPLLDRAESSASTAMLAGVMVQSTVALVHGAAPLPTVGGFLSVDGLARVSMARTPPGAGFRENLVWGWSGGVRVGLLRESFTLPGISVTATYGRSSAVTLGDPGLATDGHVEGAVSVLDATAAVSRRVLGLRLAGGLAWQRYGSAVTLRYPGAPASGTGATLEADARMERWSGFGSLTWTRLIYHATLEAGWQEPPALPTLPVGVDVDPVGWWVGFAVRMTP